jgi:hypothetical protein
MPQKPELFSSTTAVPDNSPRAISARDFWTPDKAADYIGSARQTLAKWRCLKIGPAYYRIGGRILYLREDLDAFIAGSRVDGSAAAA